MKNSEEKNNPEDQDDIITIMEEMEAITPKPGEEAKVFEKPKEVVDTSSKDVPEMVSDAVDGRSIFSFLRRGPVKPGKIFPSIPTDERYYDFTNSKVGIALIFNQMKFKGEQDRKGSKKDADDLKEVLSNIGFNVDVCDDYTVAAIKQKLLKG